MPRLGILIIVGTAVLLLLGYATGLVGQVTGAEMARLTALLALLIVIGGGMVLSRDFSASGALRHAAIWLALGAVLILAYGWRDEIMGLLTRPMG